MEVELSKLEQMMEALNLEEDEDGAYSLIDEIGRLIYCDFYGGRN